ncbi:uncharacterized protein LOC119105449 [Pollicipes pollicipes]|uniref:uncharacterized protein LOC119105449 n=1 Tax=Pollicipes pollicipes TaxID=41117 RepID=UPI001884A63F|nr:uncharacterized protein LOC119105449 [Pollicipes pollicipes]
MKRARVIVPPPTAPVGSPASGAGQSPSPAPASAPAPAARKVQGTFCLDDLKTYSSPDILICGNCREMFGDVMDMLDHKRCCCKLRFACKCGEHTSTNSSSRTSTSLLCALCKEGFSSAWDLMVHFQTAHTVNIYRLGSPPKDADSRPETVSSGACLPDAEVKEAGSHDSAALNGTPAAADTTNGSSVTEGSAMLSAAPDLVNGSPVAQQS